MSDRTRDAVYEATHAEGLTVGEWVDRALAKAAEEALHPRPPAATREDVTEVVREQLAPILVRLEALDGKADQTARVQGEAPRRPRHRLPEEVKGQIEELHHAGRSAYAITDSISDPNSRAGVGYSWDGETSQNQLARAGPDRLVGGVRCPGARDRTAALPKPVHDQRRAEDDRGEHARSVRIAP